MSQHFDGIEKARGILSAHGLVVDAVDCSGELVTCGTAQKPHGTDGRYKLHMDFPPTLWLCNYHEGGEGQTFPLYESGTLDAMTEAEKAELRERIRREKKAAQEKREKARQEAAREAERLWAEYSPATDKNAYLSRKGVLPVGGMRACDGRETTFPELLSGECLVLPVRNGEGETVSLQFIAGDGTKRFMPGGEKKGCFFPVPAKDGGKSGPLLIGEGAATVLSCSLSTGYAGLVAFDAGNLLPVAQMARQTYPGREIIICGDNDCTDKDGKPKPEEKNTGVLCARKAAEAIGAKLAICPAIRGHKADFNDLFTDTEDGPERVRVCIEKALAEKEKPCLSAGYFVKTSGPKAGLYKLEEVGENVREIRLAPPIEVLGRTRDENSNKWGILLQWHDPAGVLHRLALPDDLRQKQGAEWAAILADGGYSIEPNQQKRFLSFLAARNATRFITNTSRVGWFKDCFVLPDAAIGAEPESVVLQSLDSMANLYQTAGTLEGWQEMAGLCVGNLRFTFALCAAFAGPLLKLAGLEGGGFAFEGPSSCGKSTCLRIAASVWGDSTALRTWRLTSNGLESIATLHNDALLVLDEVGEAKARDLSEIAYMLANGAGKTRASRSGGTRASASWRLLFLSSGEVGLADKLREDGLQARAGQEVRYVGIPVDSLKEASLHGLQSMESLVLRMKEITANHYGHPSRAFLTWLVQNLDEVKSTLPEILPACVDSLAPSDAGEQVRRVAQRFAIVAAAGVCAQKAKVLPAEMEALEAVRACFGAWLDQRGNVGRSEDEAVLATVRGFIEKHGSSRFQDMNATHETCHNRAGFVRREGGKIEYLVTSLGFAEIVAGYSKKRAVEILYNAGWLKKGKDAGRYQTRVTPPGLPQTSCYVITLPAE